MKVESRTDEITTIDSPKIALCYHKQQQQQQQQQPGPENSLQIVQKNTKKIPSCEIARCTVSHIKFTFVLIAANLSIWNSESSTTTPYILLATE